MACGGRPMMKGYVARTSCANCGMPLFRALLTAMAISAGARTRDPNDCPSADNKEHRWETAEASEADDDNEK